MLQPQHHQQQLQECIPCRPPCGHSKASAQAPCPAPSCQRAAAQRQQAVHCWALRHPLRNASSDPAGRALQQQQQQQHRPAAPLLGQVPRQGFRWLQAGVCQ
jgi:hypothetical protein